MTETPQDRVDKAAKRPESDPRQFNGGTICDTPESIERYRMISVLQALKLEAKGIKVYRRRSAKSAAKRLYGISARNATVAAERLEALMKEKGIIP